MGAAAGDLDRLLAAGDLDDPESANDLLALGERPVAHERLAVAHPDARAGGLGDQRRAAPELPLARELARELLHLGEPAGLASRRALSLHEQEHELHGSSSSLFIVQSNGNRQDRQARCAGPALAFPGRPAVVVPGPRESPGAHAGVLLPAEGPERKPRATGLARRRQPRSPRAGAA